MKSVLRGAFLLARDGAHDFWHAHSRADFDTLNSSKLTLYSRRAISIDLPTLIILSFLTPLIVWSVFLTAKSLAILTQGALLLALLGFLLILASYALLTRPYSFWNEVLNIASLGFTFGAWFLTARGLLQMARVLTRLQNSNPVQARV